MFFSPVNNFHNNIISKTSEDTEKEFCSTLITMKTIFRHHPLCTWGEKTPAVENHYLFQNKPLPVPQETVENSQRDVNTRPPDCLLRNLYAGQEATVRTRHGTTDWFRIWKRVHKSFILPPCLYNLYVEYIMGNAGLDEAEAEIKIAGRNINDLR